VIVSRRPGIIFHAQPYAEDGQVLIADAYNFGWLALLLHPWRGCFIAMPRLGAALAMIGPLSSAPLVLNLLAMAFEVLPVNLLLSARSSAWGSLRFRALMAAAYIVLPNCSELSCGITESIWFSALCAFLLLVAAVPRGWVGRLFDLSIFCSQGCRVRFAFFFCL
jgi:hypothetical protein